jgi:hypothetical protein
MMKDVLMTKERTGNFEGGHFSDLSATLRIRHSKFVIRHFA